jgi:hypothetical protein
VSGEPVSIVNDNNQEQLRDCYEIT